MSDDTTTVASNPAPALHTKFQKLSDVMNGQLFERQKEIRTSLIALAAGVHFYQLGVPGIAKTRLVDALVSHIEDMKGSYFRWLMTAFTTPEEIFGVPSLKSLEQDIWRRNTTDKLPEARIAMLDEIFKASSAVLNALLTILNERLFFNDGAHVEVPLSTMFCASNEMPRGSELAALADRIDLRMEVKPLRERTSKMSMMRAKIAERSLAVPPETILTLGDIEEAKAQARQVQVPDELLEKLLELEYNLNQEGIEPSPRRLNQCPAIIQASAWLAGRTVADADDMRDLRFLLWMQPGDQPKVDKAVLEIANPLDREAMVILETIDKLEAEAKELLTDDANKVQRRRQGVEIHGKLDRVGKELKALKDKGTKTGRKSEILEEASTRLSSIVSEILSKLFDIQD